MIESPVLQELIADSARKATRKAVVKVLVARFGVEAMALEPQLKAVGAAELEQLVERAATCPDLDSFRERLTQPHQQ
jgi:hypothetical protein